MTTLRANIGDLDRLLRGHQENAQEKLAIGRVLTATRELRDKAEKLIGLAASIEELRRAGVPVEAPSALKTLPDALKEAREAAQADPLVAGRGDDPTVVRLARSLVSDVKQQVTPAWFKLKEDKPIPDVDEELLEMVSESDNELAQKYEVAAAALFALRERAEPKEGDVERWSCNVDVLRQVAQRAAELAPSDAVRTFLEAASSRTGASIEQLDDPDVRAWLAVGNRAQRFRVHSRNA